MLILYLEKVTFAKMLNQGHARYYTYMGNNPMGIAKACPKVVAIAIILLNGTGF